MPSKPVEDNPAHALRAALASPWPELQTAARNVIRDAMKDGSIGGAADVLGIGRRTLERIRAEFPGVFEPRKKST